MFKAVEENIWENTIYETKKIHMTLIMFSKYIILNELFFAQNVARKIGKNIDVKIV